MCIRDRANARALEEKYARRFVMFETVRRNSGESKVFFLDPAVEPRDCHTLELGPQDRDEVILLRAILPYEDEGYTIEAKISFLFILKYLLVNTREFLILSMLSVFAFILFLRLREDGIHRHKPLSATVFFILNFKKVFIFSLVCSLIAYLFESSVRTYGMLCFDDCSINRPPVIKLPQVLMVGLFGPNLSFLLCLVFDLLATLFSCCSPRRDPETGKVYRRFFRMTVAVGDFLLFLAVILGIWSQNKLGLNTWILLGIKSILRLLLSLWDAKTKASLLAEFEVLKILLVLLCARYFILSGLMFANVYARLVLTNHEGAEFIVSILLMQWISLNPVTMNKGARRVLSVIFGLFAVYVSVFGSNYAYRATTMLMIIGFVSPVVVIIGKIVERYGRGHIKVE
eukprot:TRINITY_DN8940_c0_g1_i1.p1 TRINITY_DN8940_c0_g1~~TRINITY_DN8940_c0_g1_i1.p1  ORF type:complete len:420 (-),score=69.08 TRINITY_DN8940_c0_g1_i1:118-1317(-)